jgi:hypothetical protein
MTKYSDRAQLGRAYLYQSYNDLDIFVEDTTCQRAWVRIARSILGPSVRLEAVFPLGGRQAVIARCAVDQIDGGRPRIYIIDGDFDLLLGAEPPKAKRLYRLAAYCLENILLSEDAIIEIAADGMDGDSDQAIRRSVNWPAFRAYLSRRLITVFRAYAEATVNARGAETSSFPVVRLLKQTNNASSLDPVRLHARIRQILQPIREATTPEERRSRRAAIRAAIAAWQGPLDYLISGKTYMLPLVHLHLRSVANFREGQRQLTVRLARHFQESNEPGLAAALREATESMAAA